MMLHDVARCHEPKPTWFSQDYDFAHLVDTIPGIFFGVTWGNAWWNPVEVLKWGHVFLESSCLEYVKYVLCFDPHVFILKDPHLRCFVFLCRWGDQQQLESRLGCGQQVHLVMFGMFERAVSMLYPVVGVFENGHNGHPNRTTSI